jgi:hypothetical protein
LIWKPTSDLVADGVNLFYVQAAAVARIQIADGQAAIVAHDPNGGPSSLVS